MATELDLSGYDNPATPGTNEGTFTVSGGLIVEHPTGGVNAGTGGYTPFLRQNDSSGSTQGFNTDDSAATASNNPAGLDMDASWTQSLLLGDLPIVYRNGVAYYEIRLDLNEPNSGTDGTRPSILLGLTELQLYTSDNQATLADYNSTTYTTRAFDEADGFHLVYDLDATVDTTLVLADGPSGSGNDDYAFYIPVSAFGEYDPTDNFTMFAQFGPSPAEEATFEEFRIQSVYRINGVKFNDLDSDGVKDPGENGLAGFTMYIDANGDDQYNLGEVTATSDANGSFTFYSLIAGNYTVREILSLSDIGADVQASPGFDATDYLPPNGTWDLTTGTVSGDHNVTITNGSLSLNVGNHMLVPSMNVDKTVLSVTNGDDNGTPLNTADDRVNSAGDVINYRITVQNTGEVGLTGVTVMDQVQAYSSTAATFVSGDANSNSILDVGETWVYSASYTVTQADIDNNGGGDGDIDNVATGDTNQTPPDSDDASVQILRNPAIDVVKTVVSVTNGDNNGTPGDLTDDKVNSAGDVINYAISIANTGNVTLTGVTVTDKVEAYGATNATAVLGGDAVHNIGDINNDGELDVGETWRYTATYVVTQADIDAAASQFGGDGDIDNIALGDTGQTPPDSDDEDVPIVFLPHIDVVKSVVSVTNGDNNGTPGDLTDDRVNSAGDIINYSLTILNDGNVALTGVTMTDNVEGQGATNATAVTAGGFNVGDTDSDGVFDVGETWRYTASYTVTQADIDAALAVGGDGDIDNVAIGDTAQTSPDSDDAVVQVVSLASIDVVKSVVSVTNGDNNGTPGDLTDDRVNSAGDVINYSLTILNNGNVALSGVTMTDQVEAHGVTNAVAVLGGDAVHNIGDTDNDGIFDVGETWRYTASYTVIQADIDAAAAHFGGDGTIDNVAVGDTAQTNPDSDDEDVPIVFLPSIDVVKSVVSVTNGDTNGTPGDLTDDRVNSAGDIINYSLTILNNGNVALTGVTMTDQVEAYGITNATAVLGGDAVHNVGDTDNDGIFDVGETWRYTASYVVTQADIDNNGGGNGRIDNIAVGDTAQTSSDSDDAFVPILRTVSVDLEKYVSVTGVDGTYVDADSALGPQNVNLGAPVYFEVTVENTGNVTLTNPLITDVNTSNGGNISVTLYDGVANTLLAGASLEGDTNNNGDIDVGETWTIRYSQPFDAGNHVNTATVTTTGVTDSDAAHYFSLVNEGPGVRTPGFWANWTDFWDGDVSVPKQAGKEGFPEYDLLRIDSDHDGDIDANDSGFTTYNGTLGLMIGDYDRDGQQDAGEDILFISLADATRLLTGKEKDMADGVVKIGRDVVATWLNYLEGNGIGTEGDTNSPRHFINDAVNYLQMFGDADGGTATNETFDVFSWSHGGVKTATSLWTGNYPGGDHSGAQIHAALDYYNNTGMTSPGGMTYAHDADDSMFLTALKVYESIV